MSAEERARAGVAAYLGVTFGGAWAAWGAAMALAPVSPRSPLFQFAILPGAFAPTVASLVVRRYVTREGFADAGLRPNLRQWRPYAFGLLYPLAGAAAIAGLASASGIAQPDFTLRRALAVIAPAADVPAAPGWLWLALPAQLFVSSIVITPVLFWAPSLAHAATNAVGGSLTLLLFLGGANWVWVSYLGILGWVPLGALCAWIVGTGRLTPRTALETQAPRIPLRDSGVRGVAGRGL